MDIDKLIPLHHHREHHEGFSSLMDIDKLILPRILRRASWRFSSLMDIDKLIRQDTQYSLTHVF